MQGSTLEHSLIARSCLKLLSFVLLDLSRPLWLWLWLPSGSVENADYQSS